MTHLKNLTLIPANQYLIVMTTADTIFLLGVAMIMFKVDYVSFFSCVMVEYVLMCSSYISAWATAALTVERYIAIVHPLLAVRLSSNSRVRWFFCWVPVPLVLHLLQFHFLVPGNIPASAGNATTASGHMDRACVPREDGLFFVELVDSLLCYVIPCAIVVVLNILVAYQMAMSRSYFHSESNANNRSSAKSVCRDSKRSGGTQSGHLKILWVVPMVFVLLNSPFYIVKLFELFEQTLEPGMAAYSHFRMILHNLSHYLYYLNFSCDVIVYAFSSSHFRKAVYNTFRKLTNAPPKKKPRYTAMTAIELSKIHNDKPDSGIGASSFKRPEFIRAQLNSPRQCNSAPPSSTYLQIEFGCVAFTWAGLHKPPTIGFILNTTYCVLFYEPFVLLTFHFLYRYYMLAKPDLINNHPWMCGIKNSDEDFFGVDLLLQYGVNTSAVPRPNLIPINFVFFVPFILCFIPFTLLVALPLTGIRFGEAGNVFANTVSTFPAVDAFLVPNDPNRMGRASVSMLQSPLKKQIMFLGRDDSRSETNTNAPSNNSFEMT
ncbi:hypothetical protein PRIPAC_75786 [Pristionchus pacificus]|nr:hypothetical protein PRIPAC_75786 [Pristionchus pacificus]